MSQAAFARGRAAHSGIACLVSLLCAVESIAADHAPPSGELCSAPTPAGSESGVIELIAAESASAREPSSPAEDASWLDLRKAVTVVKKPTSSRAARKQALLEIPLDRLSPEDRMRAGAILRSMGLFRELPVVSFETEPEVHRYFMAHPDVAVAVWRAMKISEFKVEQTAAGCYSARDADGSQGTIHIVYQGDDEVVAVCEGVYRGPILPRGIRTQAVLHLRTQFDRGNDGRPRAESRMRMFVAFPSLTVETAAKIVSPVTNLIVDRNFRDVAMWGHFMSVAMERQPGWVEHVTRQLEGIPEARRDELLKLTARMYVRARKRKLAAAVSDRGQDDAD